MARPKKEDVEVVNDTGHDIDQPVDLVPVEEPTESDNPRKPSIEERLESIGYFVEGLRQEVVTLEQRIQDLELLISQPEGGVRFGPPEQFAAFAPQQADVPDYVPPVTEQDRDGIAWY